MNFAEYHQLSAADLSDLSTALECVKTVDKTPSECVPCGSRFRVTWRSPKEPSFRDCEPVGFEQQFYAKIETKGHQRKLVIRWNSSKASLLALTSTADMNGVQHAIRYFDDANAEAACLFSGNRVTVKLTALPLHADAAKQQIKCAMAKLRQKQFEHIAQEGPIPGEPSDSVAEHSCACRTCWTCVLSFLFMLPFLLRRLMLDEASRFARYQMSLMKRVLAWSPRFSRRTYELWLMTISAVDIAYRVNQVAFGEEVPSQFNHAVHHTATVLICLTDFACLLNHVFDGPSNVYLVAGVVQFWLFPLDLLLAVKNFSFEKVHAGLHTGLGKINSKSYVLCFIAYIVLYSTFFVTYAVSIVLVMALFMLVWLGHAFPLCAKWHYKKRTEDFLAQRVEQTKRAKIVAKQRK